MEITNKRVVRITLTDAEADAMVREFLVRTGHLEPDDKHDVTWRQSTPLLSCDPTKESAAMFITITHSNDTENDLSEGSDDTEN